MANTGYACCCCGESGAKPYVLFRMTSFGWTYSGLAGYCDRHAAADAEKKAVYRLIGGEVGERIYQVLKD